MSKAMKKKRAEERRKQKQARKKANYLREGPKVGHTGRRQKRQRYGTFKQKRSKMGKDSSPTPPGVSGRRRRRKGLHIKKRRSTKRYAKFPLRPLRERRHLGAKREQ